MDQPAFESAVGVQWRNLAASEGHKGRLPASPQPSQIGLTAQDNLVLSALNARWRTVAEVVEAVGLRRDSTSHTLNKLRLRGLAVPRKQRKSAGGFMYQWKRVS